MIRSSVDSVDSRQHVYLTESEIGLGDVPADSIVEALVELNNSGSAAVSFARPAVSCGCIVTSMPANMLQPGASMQVGVKIRTGSVAETITRHVTFMSETNEFICEAAIRFNVVTPFDFVVDGAITSRLWMDNDLRDEATLQLKMQSGFEFVSLTTDAVIISPSARQTEFNDAPTGIHFD
ncbi:MAG: DUF1573 domain-containing protein [Planctomycetaceae bacterium]